MKLLRPLRWLLPLIFAVALIPAASRAEVVISVGFAPPPLLVYDQPPCPEVGLIWMPGYWAYGPDGYYWVPGAWVPAPYVGALWTPGYWGWSGGMYYWHPGYWGRHVGYYGGINYGFGYFGIGFVGGRWSGGFFEYNTAVWHVDRDRIHRIYEDRDWKRHYVDRDHDRRIAFNGGPGGIRHDPDRREREFMREPHLQHTTFQEQHRDAAMRDRNAYYNVNHGRPDRIVASRPLGHENQSEPGRRNGFNNNNNNGRFNQPPQNGARNGYQPGRGNEGNRNQMERTQQPQSHTMPAYRPAPPQQPRQQPEYRPVPLPQQHQQPEYRAQPQPRAQQERQQPQYHTQPEYRPAPQPRQQPESRPVPQQHQQPEYRQPPQSRPQERPEPRGNMGNHGNGGERPQPENHGHGR